VGPAVTFLELEESQGGPRSGVTRAEESELPDREDRFDRPGLDRRGVVLVGVSVLILVL